MKKHHILLLIIFILLGIIAAMIIKGAPVPAAVSTSSINPDGSMPMSLGMADYYASSTDMTNPVMAGMMLKTFPLDAVDSSTTVPTVTFDFAKDPYDGWNLHIVTTNFTFTPQNVNGTPVANQGHAHLYIDGQLTVVYSPWFHVDNLSSGTHTVTVALAANDHSLFTYMGAKIQQTQTIVQ